MKSENPVVNASHCMGDTTFCLPQKVIFLRPPGHPFPRVRRYLMVYVRILHTLRDSVPCKASGNGRIMTYRTLVIFLHFIYGRLDLVLVLGESLVT